MMIGLLLDKFYLSNHVLDLLTTTYSNPVGPGCRLYEQEPVYLLTGRMQSARTGVLLFIHNPTTMSLAI
jgi:hypothetical protein